jgi:hypothetical protein
MSGRQVVLAVYAAVVGVAAVMGFLLGLAQPVALEPVLFGVIALPPTPLGMVVYGVVTVGGGLGVLLALIVYVSEKYDDV